MEQRRCSFKRKNELFNGEFHPLHLRSDQVKWMSAFGRCESPCIASLCYEKHAFHSNQSKFFVVVHLNHHPDVCQEGSQVSIGVEESQCDEKIVLLSSDKFHYTYGIDCDCSSIVVGLLSTFPLSRVILSAQTDEAFQWANSLAFERGLMVAGTSQRSLLVRQGDQFLASPCKTFGDDVSQTLCHFQNLIALECYPIKQGYVHANTEIIITDDTNKDCIIPLVSLKNTDTHVKLKLVTREVLKHCKLNGCMFDSQSDAVCSPKLAERLRLMEGEMIKLKLDWENCFENLYRDSVVFDDEEPGIKDEEEYLTMSLQTVVEVENQVMRELVSLCRVRVGHRKPNDVFSTECYQLEDDTFYISPLKWFNISCLGQTASIVQEAELRVEKVDEEDVPYAKEIHLSLVLSPHYFPNAQYDQTLVKHLSKTRLLKKNDIISIETGGNVEFLCESDEKDVSCRLLHYKVMKFGEEDENSDYIHFRVDLQHTALYQLGTTNNFVPLSPATYAEDPAGLKNYIDEMKKIITPFIKGKLDASAATILLSGPPGSGKRTVITSLANLLNLHLLHVNCHELTSESSGATEAKINTAFQRVSVYAPCIAIVSGIESLGKDTETGQADHRVSTALQSAIESLRSEEHPVAIIAVTSSATAVVSKIRSLFLHQVEIKSLSEVERLMTLQQLLTLIPSGNDIDIQWIAKHTVGFTYGEFWALVRDAVANARERVTTECAVGSALSWTDEISICSAGIMSNHCDFIKALKKMQSQRADIIGVPKIPDVKWNEIGGLEEVKNVIKDTIQLPLEHPELVSAGLRRSGILLYGPPGTGKTLLAKAVATQCSLSFLSVKGPELINMYVGQSEENVRRVFSRARDAAPCVVFFDELDSLAPNRGRSGDSGGVMDRVVSQLLAELDGLVEADAEKQIFVIGASNRPDLIDPALLRPGRFDKLLYVGINSNKVDQLKILEAQTRRANLSPDVRLDEIIDVCPDNMTGADFYALTSEAMMNAIRRRIETAEARERGGHQNEDNPLVVEHDDFEKAAKNIVPSVSEKELARFQEVRAQLTSR